MPINPKPVITTKLHQGYNWYNHPNELEVMHMQNEGILGKLGDVAPVAKESHGKAIYSGFDNNLSFSPVEHGIAAAVLHRRSQRMQEALNSNQVHKNDLPAVKAELADVQAQRDLHSKESVKQFNKSQPLGKSEGSSLSRLIRIYRERKERGK